MSAAAVAPTAQPMSEMRMAAGVQDMAVETFVKISQKCKKKFVMVQVPAIASALPSAPAVRSTSAPSRPVHVHIGPRLAVHIGPAIRPRRPVHIGHLHGKYDPAGDDEFPERDK